MTNSKHVNPEFTVSEHAKERFAERFDFKVNAFAGNIDNAITFELSITGKSFKKLNSNQLAKQHVKYNGMEVHHYVSIYAVFVVALDNTVLTVYERDGTNFDNAKAWKKRRIRTEKRIAKLNHDEWSERPIYRKPVEKKYIPMTLIRRVAG
jgi:hypothetical protein